MKGKALLTDTRVGMLDNAEVGVVGVLVVHGGDVQFPTRDQYQIKVWKIETVGKVEIEGKIPPAWLLFTFWPMFWLDRCSYYRTSKTQFELDASLSSGLGT